MNKLLAALLALFLPASASGHSPDLRTAWRDDPIESKVGIHVIPNFGDDPTEFTQEISSETVRAALKGVDWVNGFHQVVVVTSPGVSMEVGGSLDPEHGLAAVYRNRQEGIELVTREAPDTISELEAILLAFLEPGDSWRQVQEFD